MVEYKHTNMKISFMWYYSKRLRMNNVPYLRTFLTLESLHQDPICISPELRVGHDAEIVFQLLPENVRYIYWYWHMANIFIVNKVTYIVNKNKDIWRNTETYKLKSHLLVVCEHTWKDLPWSIMLISRSTRVNHSLIVLYNYRDRESNTRRCEKLFARLTTCKFSTESTEHN